MAVGPVRGGDRGVCAADTARGAAPQEIEVPIKDIIEGDLKYITWDANGDTPARLRLRQYSDIAPVIIDPRFAWGAPVVESIRVPVDTVVNLWRSGESMHVVANEYGLTDEQVEEIRRTATEPAA